MDITLTPQISAWIAEKVGQGMYSSSSEVIAEGIRLLRRQEEQRLSMVKDLRQEILVGITQMAIGHCRLLAQWSLTPMNKNKKFDCVRMKSELQVQLMREYSTCKNKYSSYAEFIRSTSSVSNEVRAFKANIWKVNT